MNKCCSSDGHEKKFRINYTPKAFKTKAEINMGF